MCTEGLIERMILCFEELDLVSNSLIHFLYTAKSNRLMVFTLNFLSLLQFHGVRHGALVVVDTMEQSGEKTGDQKVGSVLAVSDINWFNCPS